MMLQMNVAATYQVNNVVILQNFIKLTFKAMHNLVLVWFHFQEPKCAFSS